eukprot:7402963-Pyramimonas_sp.AAC.1
MYVSTLKIYVIWYSEQSPCSEDGVGDARASMNATTTTTTTLAPKVPRRRQGAPRHADQARGLPGRQTLVHSEAPAQAQGLE